MHRCIVGKIRVYGDLLLLHLVQKLKLTESLHKHPSAFANGVYSLGYPVACNFSREWAYGRRHIRFVR